MRRNKDCIRTDGLCGVNIRLIQRYELSTGDTGNMTLRNAVALAKALNCGPGDLL